MARPRFRRLAHTADVRLAAWGDTEEELLRNAVLGALTCAIERHPSGTPVRRRAVEVRPGDPAARLVRAVNEALFLLYVRRELVVDVLLAGDLVELVVAPLPAHWAPVIEVKAATFHDIRLARRPRLRAVLTLDL